MSESMRPYNLLYYTPKLWERIMLRFCPLRTHETPGCVVWYKKFGRRMYIYGYVRDVTPGTYTTGSNTTDWRGDIHTGSSEFGNN